MEKLIEIIKNKIESAFNDLKRLHSKTPHCNISDINDYINDTLLIAKLMGEIDAYNDVLATIRGMKDVTISCEQVIEVLEALAKDCENNNSEGVYYYHSAIPYFKNYMKNKATRN